MVYLTHGEKNGRGHEKGGREEEEERVREVWQRQPGAYLSNWQLKKRMKVGREGGRRKGRDGCNSLDRISSTTLEVIQTDGGGQTGGRNETDRLPSEESSAWRKICFYGLT